MKRMGKFSGFVQILARTARHVTDYSFQCIYFCDMEGVVSVAYYSPEQYALLLKLADDRDKLHDTWEGWMAEYARARLPSKRGV